MTIRVERPGSWGNRLSVIGSACHSNRATHPVDSSTARDLPLPQSYVWKADPKAGLQEMLEPAMLSGLGIVAVWTYVTHPRLRPSSLLRAIVHVAVSFAGFALLPVALSV